MSAAAAPALIEVDHLTMRFGGLVAVDDVSFRARPREITAIIGPNGAGKTTVFNCITGFYKPTVGRLLLRGERDYLLERMLGHEIGQRAKVARTFQNIRLFGGMTVLENLMISQHNALMQASMKLGEAMYKAQQGTEQSEGEQKPQDDVIDADFREVGDDDKKKRA